jgi:cytochrome P450
MSIAGYLLQNPTQVFYGILIGFLSIVLYYVVGFYARRKNYPPGPLPFPLIGNILEFRGIKKHVHHIFQDIGKKYKNGIFTFYLGNDPQVVVTDPHLAVEVLKKHQFAGRPQIPIFEMFIQENSIDIALCDFNKEFEVLRKVSHSAVRKYAVSEKLTHVCADVVDQVVTSIKENDGIGKEIDMRHYIFLTMYTIIATTAFGGKYKLDDEVVKKWIEVQEIQLKNNLEFLLIGFVPPLKYVFRRAMKIINETIDWQHKFMEKNYEDHIKTFDRENIRDFTDALLLAREEAEAEEGGEVLQYLKPLNIQNCVADLFGAGTETSRLTLTWAFLLMASYPEKQQRIRQEIMKYIAEDDVPNLGHRANCHYTAAFIAETLRFRHIVPAGLPHKATVDVELGGHKIMKDTTILAIFNVGLHDKKTWGDPEVFRPERFLDEKGRFGARPNALYTPFSSGRRTCPGEKLALADIFFVIARFFQKTKDYEFILPEGPGSVDLAGDHNDTSGWVPYPYKVVLRSLDAKL